MSHTENSERGWAHELYNQTQTAAQRANRESSQRFYAAKDASERRDCTSEQRRMYEGIMRKEFFRPKALEPGEVRYDPD